MGLEHLRDLYQQFFLSKMYFKIKRDIFSKKWGII